MIESLNRRAILNTWKRFNRHLKIKIGFNLIQPYIIIIKKLSNL
jgi:hypothetical protein